MVYIILNTIKLSLHLQNSPNVPSKEYEKIYRKKVNKSLHKDIKSKNDILARHLL
jgi:hypothetical protein